MTLDTFKSLLEEANISGTFDCIENPSLGEIYRCRTPTFTTTYAPSLEHKGIGWSLQRRGTPWLAEGETLLHVLSVARIHLMCQLVELGESL